MKAGNVRKVRASGELILVLRESNASPWRRWDVMDLETGEIHTLAEKWLVHDTVEWTG